MNWLKSHWPLIGAAISAVLPFEMPSIKAYIAANPHTFLAVLLAAIVAAYYAQSPLAPKNGSNPQIGGIGMKLPVVLFALLFLSVPSHAQTAPPQPDPFETGWHVTLSGGYSNLSGQQTNNGYLTSAAVRVAKHWNARLDYFATAAPAAKIVVVGPEYNFSLAHVLPKSSYMDVSKLEGFGNARFGASHLEPCPSLTGDALAACKAAKESPGPGFKFALALGAGINYRASDKLVLRPLEVDYVRSAAGTQVIGNHLQFVSGLGLRF